MIVCKNCGYSNPDGANFCSNCRASLATPQPQQNSGKNKGCISCAGIAIAVLLLAIGGGCWWLYSYIKQQEKEADETIAWLNKGKKEWEAKRLLGEQDPDKQTYNGQSVRALAEELNFPVSNYGELPEEGRVYRTEDEARTFRFANINFTEGDYIGKLDVSPKIEGTSEFWVSPCGCSIYHLTDPDNKSEEHGYFFVDKGAKRILLNSGGEIHEFKL